MHLGLDLLFLVPGASGGRETYARELTSAIRAQRNDLRVTAFVNRETAAVGHGFWHDAADDTVVLSAASAVDRRRWAVGEFMMLPRAAARERVDVLHCPANFAPLHGPFARVVTLHDLLLKVLPDHLPGRVAGLYFSLMNSWSIRSAARILTDRTPVDVETIATAGSAAGDEAGDPEA